MSRIVVIAIGRVLTAFSAVVAVRLYTELLGPEQVGRLSLLLASISLFNLFLVAPVSSWVMRKAIEWHARGTLIDQLRRPLLYSLLSSAFAATVSAGFIRAGLLATSLLVAPLVGFAVLGAGLSGFGSQLFNYLGRPFHYVLLSVMMSWAGVALAGLLCFRVSATAEVWMIGTIAAQVLGGLVSIAMIRSRLGPADSDLRPSGNAEPPGFDVWAILLYSGPMLVATGLSWLQTDGYRYLFAHMVDERTLGLFAAGLAVGISPMLLLDRLLGDTYLPILTRAVALKGREHWPRSWDEYASAAILPLVLFAVLGCSGTHLFARLLVSRAYYGVAWLGAFGCLAKGLQMMSSMYVGFSYAVLETAHLIRPYFIGAAATIGCIFLLAPIHYPYISFGVSLIAGAAAVLVAVAWAARKRYFLRFPYFSFARAVALAMPIAGVNFAAEHFFTERSAFGAIVLLAADTLYMAILCWILHPRDADSDQDLFPSARLASEQGVQA